MWEIASDKKKRKICRSKKLSFNGIWPDRGLSKQRDLTRFAISSRDYENNNLDLIGFHLYHLLGFLLTLSLVRFFTKTYHRCTCIHHSDLVSLLLFRTHRVFRFYNQILILFHYYFSSTILIFSIFTSYKFRP